MRDDSSQNFERKYNLLKDTFLVIVPDEGQGSWEAQSCSELLVCVAVESSPKLPTVLLLPKKSH